MSCRRHGTKPTIALWMLVAVADAVLIVASIGIAAVLLALVGVAVAVAGVRLLQRGTVGATAEAVPARAEASRRA